MQLRGSFQGHGRFLHRFLRVAKVFVKRRVICDAQNLIRVARHWRRVRSGIIRALVAFFLNVCHLRLVRLSCRRLDRFLGYLRWKERSCSRPLPKSRDQLKDDGSCIETRSYEW